MSMDTMEAAYSFEEIIFMSGSSLRQDFSPKISDKLGYCVYSYQYSKKILFASSRGFRSLNKCLYSIILWTSFLLSQK